MKKKNNIYIALLSLVITTITVFNLVTGKTITFIPLTNEETGRIQLIYYVAMSSIMDGFFHAYMWSTSHPLLVAFGYLLLLSPIFELIASLLKNKKLVLFFSFMLLAMHIIAGLEVPFRIGLRHWELGGAAAYAVYNLNYFVTFACTILIIYFSIHMDSNKKKQYISNSINKDCE